MRRINCQKVRERHQEAILREVLDDIEKDKEISINDVGKDLDLDKDLELNIEE